VKTNALSGTPLVRFVVDLLYNKLSNKIHNRSTTDRNLARWVPSWTFRPL